MKKTNSTEKTRKRSVGGRASRAKPGAAPSTSPPAETSFSDASVPVRPAAGQPAEALSSAAAPNPLAASVSIKERISLLAYSYWQEGGCKCGTAEQDWFRAEREILGSMTDAKQ